MKRSFIKIARRFTLQKSYRVTNTILDRPRPLTYKYAPCMSGPILFTGSPFTQKSFHANAVATKLNFGYLNNASKLNNSNINKNVILDVCPSTLSNDIINSIPMVIHFDDTNDDDILIINNNNSNNINSEAQQMYQEYKNKIIPIITHFHQRDVLISFDASSPCNILNKAVIDAIYGNKLYINDQHLAFDKLDNILSNNKYLDINEYKTLCSEFINYSLNENINKRTGLKRRCIFFVTNNNIKVKETEHMMDRYGIEVLKTPHSVFNHPSFIKELMEYRNNEFSSIALLKEESHFVKPGTNDIKSTMRNGVNVDHISILNCILKDNKHLQFKHVTKGAISNNNKKIEAIKILNGNNNEVFGCDDIFEIQNTGKTYQEHKIIDGVKISSRDMVLSKFLKEKIYYKSPKTIKFDHSTNKNMSKATRTINFELDAVDLINDNPLYNISEVHKLKLNNIFNYGVNDGVFIKCPTTRLQQNYWSPGLNAGLPLIPKKDAIHEATFMFHDFAHFAMKDLIFNGENSYLHYKTYICHRMISEAISLILADVLFVHCLKINGIKYDFSKRKIYPLFSQLFELDSIINESNMDNGLNITKLKEMMYSNVKFVLEGDERYLLMNNYDESLEKALNDYKEKYVPFFVSDFQWTQHNFNNMCNQTQTMRRWWNVTQTLRDSVKNDDVQFQTIGDFIEIMKQKYNHHDNLSFVDKIFEIIFEENIMPIFTTKHHINTRISRLHKAFTRYFMGQMAFYSKYSSIPGMMENEEKIINMFLSQIDIKQEALKLDAINCIRHEFEENVDKLCSDNIISADDAYNFKEIYPLFKPFYLTYDEELDQYPKLKETANSIISENAYLKYHKECAQKIIGHRMNNKENKYYEIMCKLIENTGGQIYDGLFVIKPGIDIISITKYYDNDSFPINDISSQHIFVTFAMNGISIETLLEFIAHSESFVSRLTTSNTKAMNIPLYRINANDETNNNEIINCLKSQIIQKNAFEDLYNPRNKWNKNGNEIFNQLSSATKCSFCTYTMTLFNLKKMLIGRLKNEGNETEVKQIARIMCTKLHCLFKEIIPSFEEFEEMSNNQKYLPSSQPKQSMDNYLKNLFNDNINIDGDDKIKLIAYSDLTSIGNQLFESMNINGDCCNIDKMAEYWSRITYLSFKDKKCDINDRQKYLLNIIKNKGHKSILNGFRVSFGINGKYISHSFQTILIQLIYECGGNVYICYDNKKERKIIKCMLISLNLKQLNQFLLSIKPYLDEMDEMDENNKDIIKQLIEKYHKMYPIAIENVNHYL